jgi:hypothetical protein
MKTFATLTVSGVVGIVLFKLLAGMLFPLLGVVVGLLLLTVKIAIFAAIGYFIYSMIRKRKEAATA